jgi:hypothetical protein
MVWVMLAVAFAFGGSLYSAFHFDDYGMLQDPTIVSPGGWMRCWGLLQTRPLTWFTFWMNYQIAGREPFLWHAINLGLHVGCCVVLYRLLQRILPQIALPATMIFALHPFAAEPVDYVYARAILLCTLFSLLAINDWFRYRQWPAVAWFALAVLSKEECVTVPLVLALVTLYRRRLREAVPALAAMLGLAALAGMRVIAAIQATGTKNIGVNAGISPLEYLSEQGLAILRYIGLLVLPWQFSIDPQVPMAAWMWRVLAWALLAALIVVAGFRFREVRAAFWILGGFILLIPSSSVFPAADLAAGRRMYLPMVAFAPAIVLLAPAKFWRTPWALLLPCVLTLLSVEQTYVWGSDERLWGEAMRLAPEKVRPRIQYSRAVAPAAALGILQEAERLAPQDPDIATEMARIYLELDRPGEALAQSGRALALTPREPHALNNRGAVLLAMSQTAAARRDFVAALQIDPCLREARENLERSGGIPADAPRCASGE